MKTQEATARSETAQRPESHSRYREAARPSVEEGVRAELSIHKPSVGDVKDAPLRAQPNGGHLATCAYCGRTGFIKGRWHDIRRPMPAGPSTGHRHTICATCYETVVKPEVDLVYRYLNGPVEERQQRTGSFQVKTPMDDTVTVPIPA
jgi:hypothetical protein